MLFETPLPFVTEFVEILNGAIKEHKAEYELSRIQRYWLSFCIMAVIITNSVCWAKFERAGIGKYSLAALSWMFRRSKIPWELLLCKSVRVILRHYGITKGVLALDDSDSKRSKNTKTIPHVHKLKDKASGGFVMGQCIVFLLLITPKCTIPVGFCFYMPDPKLTEWYILKKKLKKAGVPGRERPPKPPKNENYPTKQEIALLLLEQFRSEYPDMKVKCILADALYGTTAFMDRATQIFGNIQVISQIRSTQNIRVKNKKHSVADYFSKHPGVPQKISIRGGEEVTAIIGSARLHVCSHSKKRFIIALKYEGETDYRYIVGSDLTWQTTDIVQAYTLRWLVEVFIQDWKSYEGWENLAKQPGEEGSCQSLILSLLTDHCLLLHPEQESCMENKLPAFTVGSLQAVVKVESLIFFIRELLTSGNAEERIKLLVENLKKVITLSPSTKHMVNPIFTTDRGQTTANTHFLKFFLDVTI